MTWGGGKKERKDGGKKGRKEGSKTKQEGRTEAGYGIMKKRRTTGSGILLRNF